MTKTESKCKHSYKWEENRQCLYPIMKDENGEDMDFCIFHAPMDMKEDRLKEFWERFEKHFNKTERDFNKAETKEEKDEIEFDCEEFVFPDTGYVLRREYPFYVTFLNATFTGVADFVGATFRDIAYFYGVIFEDIANFKNTTLIGGVYFYEATFKGNVSFFSTEFIGEAGFDGATFESTAFFFNKTFASIASFSNVTFEGRAYFRGIKFKGFADFIGATFERTANFTNSTFEDSVDFYDSTFEGKARFKGAIVLSDFSLNETQFISSTDFRDVNTDKREVDRKVSGETKTIKLGPGKIRFNNAHFHTPERVLIGGKDTNLERWSFHGTNIESVKFTLENWPVKSKRKYCYDEVLAADEASNITCKEAGEVYRKLRLNYENRLAYDEASDFHYGQMECRLHDSERPKWDRRLTRMYKFISLYGQSVSRPLVIWLLIFLVFTVFYMLIGFDVPGFGHVGWLFSSERTVGPNTSGWWQQLGFGALQSLKAALSLKLEGDGKLAIPVVAALQKLFSATLITFFVLALKRKFKR